MSNAIDRSSGFTLSLACVPQRDLKGWPMATLTAAHKDGALRLDSALREEDRCREQFERAIGTSAEFGACSRLGHAHEVVSARQAWLTHIDKMDAFTAAGMQAVATGVEAHDHAMEQLARALTEQTSSGECYRSALGTSDELHAYGRLQAASEMVAARQRWLDEVDGAPSH